MIDDDLGVLRDLPGARRALPDPDALAQHELGRLVRRHAGARRPDDFGKDVVRELNRLGLMVDISHVSDKTFFDALEATRAPLIASHSSARAISDTRAT